MSVENKIKQLLSRANGTEQLAEATNGDTTQPMQGSSQKASADAVAVADGKPSANTTKDTSKAGQGSGQGDTTQPMMGNSKKADVEEVADATGKNSAAAKASSEPKPTMKGDAKTVKTQANEETEADIEWVINEEDEDNATAKVAGHKVTLHRSLSEPGTSDTYTLHHPSGDKKVKISFNKHGDGEEVHGDKVNHAFGLDSKHKLGHKIANSMNGMGGISKFEESVNIKGQLDSIFGEDLSEEFRTKATSIFEAAVIARVNNEMEKVTAKLEEQTATQLVEFKETLVEKVDGYLNYVVEQYMEENKLAVESGLRTEIAEDFINGMKTLFKEHFIEVPEEKYDVLEDLQTKSADLQTKLDESITQSIELAKELNALKAAAVLDEQTKDLAATEAEKLKKLVEGVDFDSEDLYREKVSVIKENYFPKTPKQSPEKMLVEESGTNPAAFVDNNSMMSKYVSVLSRTVKTR